MDGTRNYRLDAVQAAGLGLRHGGKPLRRSHCVAAGASATEGGKFARFYDFHQKAGTRFLFISKAWARLGSPAND
jgi:hypothetical protein